MTVALIGRKVGMTRYFTPEGRNIPVTVIQAGPCYVTQIKTLESDGYPAVQLGYEDIKPERSRIPVIGHDARAGVSPKRVHRELRLEDDPGDYELGQEVTVEVFREVPFVDIVATSKGKGFAGVMKRHNFKGLSASHGTERKHRSAGAIAAYTTNRGTSGKIKKGKPMAGHMGHERVTVRNLDVVEVVPERNLLIVKGAVPGPNTGLLFVRTSKRLGRAKQLAVKSAKK